MKKLLIMIFGFIAALTLQVGATGVADFFIRPAADAILPFTDRDKRLDLLDYYRIEGAGSRVAPEGFPASILTITALSDTAMTVSARGVTFDIALFTPVPSDTIIVVSRTVRLGGREDSTVELFDKDFVSKGQLSQPRYSDWIKPAFRKDMNRLSETLPFVTGKAVLRPSENKVIFVNTAVNDFTESKDAFKPEIAFTWVKDKFKAGK